MVRARHHRINGVFQFPTYKKILVVKFYERVPMQNSPFLTIIGIRVSAKIEVAALTEALKLIDTDRQYSVNAISLAAGRTDQGLLVDVEGLQFTIIPNKEFSPRDFAEAVTGSVLNWAGAASGLEEAKTSIIIAVNCSATDHPSAVKAAFLLSVITEAVVSVANTAFVFWGTANHLIEPSAFSQAVSAMLKHNQPPILQWVRFDIFRGTDVAGEMTGGMRSTGLAHFVGHELLLEPLPMRPTELARRTVGYADELIKNGPSGVRAIAGPDTGERISLSTRTGGDSPLVVMTSDATAFKEVQ